MTSVFVTVVMTDSVTVKMGVVVVVVVKASMTVVRNNLVAMLVETTVWKQVEIISTNSVSVTVDLASGQHPGQSVSVLVEAVSDVQQVLSASSDVTKNINISTFVSIGLPFPF